MTLSISELQPYLDRAVAGDGRISNEEQLLFPYYDLRDRTSRLAAVMRAQVTTPTGHHTVLVSYQEVAGQSCINMWCGDRYSEGRLDLSDAVERCREATAGLPDGPTLSRDMQAKTYATCPESTACGFWAQWNKDKTICKHLSSYLYHLKTTNPNFIDLLAVQYQTAVKGASATKKGGAASRDTYALEELGFRVPVLFEGDRGAGKTHTARQFARENKFACVECPGHEGIEAPDLLGFLVPYGPQQMVWKDGPISEAFRRARKEKTVLILDELLRVPTRELSLLLTAFSPDEGFYRLRTGRILSVEDGVATEEVLECPVENLCVVATTNVGAEYAVDDIDPALAERFVVIRMDTSSDELKRILKQVAKEKGLSESLVGKAMTFYTKMVEANKRGLVQRTPTTRTMSRAFILAMCDDDVKRGLRSQFLLWVARTSEGVPVAEQVKCVTDILNTAFK